MSVLIAKRLEWDMGHRLLRHEGLCAHVHGHRYAATFLVGADALDEVGRVLDFAVVKRVMGKWIGANLDHAFLAQEGDPLISWLRKNGQRHYVIPDSPTAENIAALLYHKASRLLPRTVRVEGVHVAETPTSVAVYSPKA